MSKIATKLTDLIGNTPLLEITNYEANNNLDAKIIAKLEYFNPLGSVKDRVAYAMIEKALLMARLTRILLLLSLQVVIRALDLRLLLLQRV